MVVKEEVLMKTIFVSIAAMDDTEVVPTVLNAFDSATYPERIVVGVGLAALEPSIYNELTERFKDDPRLRITYEQIQRNDLEPLGVGKGRWRAVRQYKNEDYMLQVDCHTHFADGWDVEMIDLFEKAKQASGNPKTIMTTYIGLYGYSPDRKVIRAKNAYPCFIPNELWLSAVPSWEDVLMDKRTHPEEFYPNVKFNPACAFGDKEWAQDSGVDPNAMFYDEDLLYSINLFDKGFSFVFPNKEVFPITHLNGDDINEFGGERMFFTDYVTPEQDEEISEILRERYFEFLSKPENAAKIRKYEKYAKINAKFGAIMPRYVPKGYR
jgi:hypothetical protein